MSQILVLGSATSVKEVPNKYLSMSDLIKKFDLSYMERMCIVTCLYITQMTGLNKEDRFLWVLCKYTFTYI